MVYIIWEFQIDSAQATLFEKIYGPKGDWDLLFRQAKGYHSTLLLKNIPSSGRYLTIDRWNSIDDFERFKIQHRKAYNDLDAKCEQFTLIEKKVGIFESV